MLVIRKTQMRVFELSALLKFEDDVVGSLKASCPEETGNLSETDLRAFIRSGISKSEKYSVTDEADVRRFLEFMLRHNAGFELQADASWAAGILRDEQLSGMEKMDQIEEAELFTRRPA